MHPWLKRQATIGLAVFPIVTLPVLAGYAASGILLGLILGLAAAVTLAALDDGLLDGDSEFRQEARGRRSRGEMSTKQIIATGGATVSSVGIVGLIKQDVIGGITYALTYGVVGFINGLFDTMFSPVNALVTGLADIISSALTGMLIDSGFRVAAESLQSYGIIAPIVAGVITLALGGVLYVALQRMDFSPLRLIYDKLPG